MVRIYSLCFVASSLFAFLHCTPGSAGSHLGTNVGAMRALVQTSLSHIGDDTLGTSLGAGARVQLIKPLNILPNTNESSLEPDRDEDGVNDKTDNCQRTPLGKKVYTYEDFYRDHPNYKNESWKEWEDDWERIGCADGDDRVFVIPPTCNAFHNSVFYDRSIPTSTTLILQSVKPLPPGSDPRKAERRRVFRVSFEFRSLKTGKIVEIRCYQMHNFGWSFLFQTPTVYGLKAYFKFLNYGRTEVIE